MPQILKTKTKGNFEFVRTWVNGNQHVGLLKKGGYMHVGGIPIKLKKEITDCIPTGPDRDRALEWLDGKINPVEPPARKILLASDGAFTFDDGSSVTSPADIVNNTSPGPLQDELLRMFSLKQREEEKELAKEATRVKNTSKKLTTKLRAELDGVESEGGETE